MVFRLSPPWSSMSPCIGYFRLPRLIKPMNFGTCLDKPLVHQCPPRPEVARIDSMTMWLECVDCHVLAALFTFIHIWYMGVSENDLNVCPWNGYFKGETVVLPSVQFCHQHPSAIKIVPMSASYFLACSFMSLLCPNLGSESIFPVRLVLDL